MIGIENKYNLRDYRTGVINKYKQKIDNEKVSIDDYINSAEMQSSMGKVKNQQTKVNAKVPEEESNDNIKLQNLNSNEISASQAAVMSIMASTAMQSSIRSHVEQVNDYKINRKEKSNTL